MIHHCEVLATPRRVTVIPAVPPPAPVRRGRTWVSVVSAIALLCTIAASLGAQPARPARPDTAKAAPTRSIAWTSDRRSFAVGDIIKVVVDEYALAQATKNNVNAASRSRNMTLGIDPPATSAEAAMPNIEGSVGTGDAGQSQQRGNATRDTRYLGEIPVRVVAIAPDGMLQIKGTKTIDVDKNKQTLMLSGFVRPIDIGSSDMVGSDMVADAQISYQSKGSLGKPRNGIVSKILGIFWP